MFNVLIPARLKSSRLPEKPLKMINGKPLIYWTWQQCLKSNAEEVIILTDSKKVALICESFGANVRLTCPNAGSGIERIYDFLKNIDTNKEDIWVNVQGDEPMIDPRIINQVANILETNKGEGIATLAEKISDVNDIFDPNLVKVIINKKNEAIYFSRAPIPFSRDTFFNEIKQIPENQTYHRHIGIYSYRTRFINDYNSWNLSTLEDTEKLEQLRVLWEGEKILIEEAVADSGIGVDTPEDLEKVREIFKNK